MPIEVSLTTRKGQLDVAYRRRKGEWHAIALQFDIVGIGRTQGAALRQMKELVEEYILDIANRDIDTKRVQFFNPSSVEEWNLPKRESFLVTLILAKPTYFPEPLELSDFIKTPSALRANMIKNVELQSVSA